MKTIVSFGETLWDLLPTGPVLGGAPCNFAYRVQSLGDRGVLVTRLGRDELGKKALDAIRRLGMDVAHVQTDETRPTGTVPVKIDDRGVPDFTITPDVAYDYIDGGDALRDLAKRADAVCFGTLVQRSPSSRATLYRLIEAAPRALKFLDINLRKGCFSKATIAASLDRADVLKLNDGEVFALKPMFGLRGRTLEALVREIRRHWTLDACVATLGERGALAVTRDEQIEVPGRKVKVVDTVGSGDAFGAAFVCLYLRGRSLYDCCFFGNALGAWVATQEGATASITLEDFERFAGRPFRN